MRGGMRIGGARGHAIGTALALVLAATAPGCLATPEERAARAAQEQVHRGDLALARGQAESAEVDYRAAIALYAGQRDAWLGLARAQSAQGRDLEALASYDALGKLDPERLAAVRVAEVCPLWIRASLGALEAGETATALSQARRAGREGCQGPAAASVLASALSATALGVCPQDPQRAADLYAEAASADPTDAAAFVRAGLLLLRLQRREAALTLLSEALRLHPRDAVLQTLMVDALAQRTPASDSAPEFEQACPSSPSVMFHTAIQLGTRGVDVSRAMKRGGAMIRALWEP
jgi:tetratricopeptide (TPR) repeat protein